MKHGWIIGHGGKPTKLSDAAEPVAPASDPHAGLTAEERTTADSMSRHSETMTILRNRLANRQPVRGYRISPYE